MKTLIGAAVVAGVLALAGPGAIGPAAAASPKAGVQALDTSQSDRIERAAPLSLRLSPILPALLLRPALLLSALSLLLAGPIHIRVRLWAWVVVTADGP